MEIITGTTDEPRLWRDLQEIYNTNSNLLRCQLGCTPLIDFRLGGIMREIMPRHRSSHDRLRLSNLHRRFISLSMKPAFSRFKRTCPGSVI